MDRIDFTKINITGGLWKQKQDMVRRTTAMAVYNRFDDTGRIDAFKCDWKEGMPNRPHIFWDSDVAKWIEGVAYLISKRPAPKLEKLCDRIIANIVKNQREDGYFNIYYMQFEPQNIFTNRDWHELYCAGHLVEAAIAYFNATGKREFLDAMCRYMDYIEKRFVIDKDTGFTSPGHEEIELALVKLYDVTGEKRYLDLSMHFINERGTEEGAGTVHPSGIIQGWNIQTHAPVREQHEAVGHAVRAGYLYSAMADLAYKTDDEGLLKAVYDIFDDIYTKKMYITGGVGSSSCGEAFTIPYDLSNLLAYTESCAGIALCYFANKMLRFEADSRFSDTIERVMYNGFLSTVSLDGKSFFYENPLEVIPYLHIRDAKVSNGNKGHWPQMQRQEVFGCSCCPPNILRFIASIGDYMYSTDNETLYVHQFMQSESDIEIGGKKLHVSQSTKYPESGVVNIKVAGGDCRVAVRIPGWCENYKGETTKGYAYFDVKDGETLRFDFGMKTRFVEARPELVFDCNRYAVMRGPVVYCMESVDNGDYIRDIRIDSRARFSYGKHEELGVPCLTVKAYRRECSENAPLYSTKHNSLKEVKAVLIPYYAFANRGVAEMQVWQYIK